MFQQVIMAVHEDGVHFFFSFIETHSKTRKDLGNGIVFLSKGGHR